MTDDTPRIDSPIFDPALFRSAVDGAVAATLDAVVETVQEEIGLYRNSLDLADRRVAKVLSELASKLQALKAEYVVEEA